MYVNNKNRNFTATLSLFMNHRIFHCKNEPVILTLIWLLEFQCCIDNKYYACEV